MEVQALTLEMIQDTLVPPRDPVPPPPLPSVTAVPSSLIDATFSTATNLSTTALGARVLSCSDEYFVSAANLLTPTRAVRKAGVYMHTGAWYDGWETRWHNPNEYDWVVIKLGCVGTIDVL
jgi:allantoicase